MVAGGGTTLSARANGRHKRQSGGHGQFGDVWLEIEPLPMGGEETFVFEDKIVGGVVPGQFIPGVEKGVVEGPRMQVSTRGIVWSGAPNARPKEPLTSAVVTTPDEARAKALTRTARACTRRHGGFLCVLCHCGSPPLRDGG